MEDKHTSVKAFTVLMKSSQSVQKLIKQDFLMKDINVNEYAILELLYHRGDQPIQVIGKRILLGGGSITYVIDKLEDKGFIYRKPCASDRRRMYACITEEGKEYMERRVPEQEAIISKVFSDVSESELESAISVLKRIGKQADSLLKK